MAEPKKSSPGGVDVGLPAEAGQRRSEGARHRWTVHRSSVQRHGRPPFSVASLSPPSRSKHHVPHGVVAAAARLLSRSSMTFWGFSRKVIAVDTDAVQRRPVQDRGCWPSSSMSFSLWSNVPDDDATAAEDRDEVIGEDVAASGRSGSTLASSIGFSGSPTANMCRVAKALFQ